MTKNYFTDEQIKSLVLNKLKADGVDITEAVNAPSESELKHLKEFANLAVEAVIGEPFAFEETRISNQETSLTYSDDGGYKHKGLFEYKALYKVKELE